MLLLQHHLISREVNEKTFFNGKVMIYKLDTSSVHSKIRNVLHFLEMHFLPLGEVVIERISSHARFDFASFTMRIKFA